MPVRLSVNVNKIATLRNARGGNLPNLLMMAQDILSYGAHGITEHPRPDQRHIRYEDVTRLRQSINQYNQQHHTDKELNIEGNPREPRFVELVLQTKPTQVTLVPDEPAAITSQAGWDCVAHQKFLAETVRVFQKERIRVSIFVDPDVAQIRAAHQTGCDRVELYTEAYARAPQKQIDLYARCAQQTQHLALGLNAGHDLSLDNLGLLVERLTFLQEVSVGHALICEALYHGMPSVIGQYLNLLGYRV